MNERPGAEEMSLRHIAQAPWAYMIGRFPAGRVLGVSTLIWGYVATIVSSLQYINEHF